MLRSRAYLTLARLSQGPEWRYDMSLRQQIGSYVGVCALAALAACGAADAGAPAAVGCSSPAPIRNTRDSRAPQIFVGFRPGVDGSVAIARLQTQFQLEVLWQPTAQTGFLTSLTDPQITSIQCDSAVAYLEWNVLGSLGARSPAT